MPVQRAGFGPTLALTATLALGSAVAAISLLILVTEPKPLPAPLAGEQNQDVETALYVIVFALILPLALIVGPRIADRVAAGPNGAALPGLTALLGAGLAAAILAVRFSGGLPWEDGVGATLGAVGIWAAAVSLLLVRARNRARPRLLGICRHPERLWALTAALGLGVLVGLTDPGLSWPVAAVVGLAIPALVAIRRRRPAGPLPRGWGGAFDGAVIALLILAIPDLVIFRPEESSGDFAVSFETFVIQFHHNFLLGPANEVLAGGAVLVDTASQYGVAPLYLISGWFQLAPAGYGTLGLLDGAVTALAFAAAYAVLRICGCNRPLAAGTIAIGVVALAYNLSYPVGGLPEQGQLRFGLPMALIAFTVAGLRWPRWVRLAGCGALATIGLTSIWSLEAFAVTAATAIAIGAVHAWLLPAGSRRGWIGRATALAAISCLAAHLILAAATLAAAGELPDWGQYLAYLEGFLFGKLGEITYDFAPWSPALAVGAGYLTSAIAIALLVRRRPELVRREPISMIALTGATAYGIALFSYFVDRSAAGILPYVGLPALLTGALWLGLLMRVGQSSRSRPPGELGLAAAMAVAALLIAAAWPAARERFPRSALAHAPPGGKSLRDALDRLWHPPPLNPSAPAGERLLDRHQPGPGRALILTLPDLAVEILVRSERGSTLALGDPLEDSFVAAERLPGLRESVAELRAGDRLLIDRPSLRAFAALKARPSLDPLAGIGRSGEPAPLQKWALRAIGERFRLQTLERTAEGLAIVRLVPRRLRA